MAKKTFSFPKIESSENFSRISTYVDWEPSTNIIEAGEIVLVEVELPGVNKEDVSIVLENDNILVIRGVKPQPRLNEAKKRVRYHLFEREFGSFYKRILLDLPVDSSKIQSEMENGVLTLKIPKKKIEPISVEIK